MTTSILRSLLCVFQFGVAISAILQICILDIAIEATIKQFCISKTYQLNETLLIFVIN